MTNNLTPNLDKFKEWFKKRYGWNPDPATLTGLVIYLAENHQREIAKGSNKGIM